MKAYRIKSREIIENWEVQSREDACAFGSSVAFDMRKSVLQDLLPVGSVCMGKTVLVESGEWAYDLDSAEGVGIFMVSLHQYLTDELLGHGFARSTFWVLESEEIGGSNE